MPDKLFVASEEAPGQRMTERGPPADQPELGPPADLGALLELDRHLLVVDGDDRALDRGEGILKTLGHLLERDDDLLRDPGRRGSDPEGDETQDEESGSGPARPPLLGLIQKTTQGWWEPNTSRRLSQISPRV